MKRNEPATPAPTMPITAPATIPISALRPVTVAPSTMLAVLAVICSQIALGAGRMNGSISAWSTRTSHARITSAPSTSGARIVLHRTSVIGSRGRATRVTVVSTAAQRSPGTARGD